MGSTREQRLFILDTDISHPDSSQGRIVSCRTDGTDLRTVVGHMTSNPDGIVVDHERGHMYWTNMGPTLSANNGSIERANLDGTDRRTIVPTGTVGVHTPKQITLARRSGKLYWCDREGMKVMRCSLDGSDVEVLISTGNAAVDHVDMCHWCVGVTVDETRGYFYWSQKGPSKGKQGRIFRARVGTPASGALEPKPDVETVLEGLPEPIDLEVDEDSQTLYWTDRGDPPRGNSLNCMSVANVVGPRRGEWEILATRLHEAIGLAVDVSHGKIYVTDLAGGVYAIDMKSKEKKVLFPELGDLTGIALA